LPQLAVHYLPQFVSESELAGSTVVVVDLLRASTTICHALAYGAKCVVPCLEIAETWTRAKQFSRDQIVLGGERGGERIEGFDLGNSPADYTADQVFGRTVLFTTTNGTKALAHARLASRVLIGAAANRATLAETIVAAPQIDILSAPMAKSRAKISSPPGPSAMGCLHKLRPIIGKPMSGPMLRSASGKNC